MSSRSQTPRTASKRRSVAACTIVARNYLAQAKVLAESFFRHEPDGRFYLLVVDGLPKGASAGRGVKLVAPEKLGIPNFYDMCFRYNVIELNTAVKPSLLRLLLRQEREIIYLDPDILIARPLDSIREALDKNDIVLTPHILTPLPLDGKHPLDQDILVSGVSNLGFIALRRTSEADRLLRWWGERLAEHCRIDVANGLFTDQRWMDLVPCLFPSMGFLRDDTCNVAFWNLHERKISRRGRNYFINGRPLTFYHFSGYDPAKPRILSKHQTRVTVKNGTPLANLLDHYGRLLNAAGHPRSRQWEYGYSRFANGASVNSTMRQLYLGLDKNARRRFGNPFTGRGKSSFLNWAIEPCAAAGGLSRFLQTIYRLRYDLAAAFPEPYGKDRERFLEWAATQGALEMGYEPKLAHAPAVSSNGKSHAPAVVSRPEPVRTSADDYAKLVEHVRRTVSKRVAAKSRVLIISKGDDQLLRLTGCEGGHFPQNETGGYAGYNPQDSATAIAHLEALQKKGAQFLVLPSTANWWLEYYKEFAAHLDRNGRLSWRDPHCTIYELRTLEVKQASANAVPPARSARPAHPGGSGDADRCSRR